jgi:hypothetical protein
MHLLAQSGVLTGLVLAALGAVIAWLLLRTHRYLSRQARDDSPLVRVARPQRTQPGHHLDAPPAELRWEVQMHETARELSAQLDSKMGALQTLIAEADRAAARLEAAAALPSVGRENSLSNGPCGAIGEAVPGDSQPATQAEALRPSGPSDRAPSEGDQLPARPSIKRRQEEIYTLADYGLSAAEIARRVGSPVGEVQLILGLREKK